MTPRAKSIVKLLDVHYQDIGRSIDDFLSASYHAMAKAAVIANPFLPASLTADQHEAEYARVVARQHEPKMMTAFAECYALLVAEIEDTRSDVLGEIVSETGYLNAHAGQFFTPVSLARLMASVTCDVDGVREMVARTGYASVGEPCAGAGVLPIELARHLVSGGVDLSDIWFDLGDVDWKCCRMTYVQASLLGMCGVVKRQNALSNEPADNVAPLMMSFRFTMRHTAALRARLTA